MRIYTPPSVEAHNPAPLSLDDKSNVVGMLTPHLDGPFFRCPILTALDAHHASKLVRIIPPRFQQDAIWVKLLSRLSTVLLLSPHLIIALNCNN